MSSRDNLLNDKKNCSFKEGDVENVYYTDTIGACGKLCAFRAHKQLIKSTD